METVYRELVVRGNATLLEGFLWGFRTAKRLKKGLFFGADYPIKRHHLKAFFKMQGDHVHIIVTAKINDALVAAVQEASGPLEMKIVSNRRVKTAKFNFEFKTFSRDVARDLKNTLRRLPVSLELYNYKPKERIDPGAKGAELYTPTHDYEFSGVGGVRGDLGQLLKLHKTLDAHVFIEVDDIELVH